MIDNSECPICGGFNTKFKGPHDKCLDCGHRWVDEEPYDLKEHSATRFLKPLPKEIKDKVKIYELEKARIARTAESSQEYEVRLNELAKRLGI